MKTVVERDKWSEKVSELRKPRILASNLVANNFHCRGQGRLEDNPAAIRQGKAQLPLLRATPAVHHRRPLPLKLHKALLSPYPPLPNILMQS